MDEQAQQWREQNRKWDENQATIREMMAEIKSLGQKHDSTIGALGARWGLHSEQSFRNALKGIQVYSHAGDVDLEIGNG